MQGRAGVLCVRYHDRRAVFAGRAFLLGVVSECLFLDLRSNNLDCRRSRSRSRGRGDDRGGGGGGSARLKGEAARWNPRGFGFIKPLDGGEDLFCHVSCITDGNVLREGDTVEYEVTAPPPACLF